MEKTPLKGLLDFCQDQYKKDIEVIDPYWEGKSEVWKIIIEKAKVLLPAERKMVEDANFSGIEYGAYYGNEMAEGMASEYFDENYEQ